MKKYANLDKIPSGEASNEITAGCLVLEGGAFRGLYTEGVLDALMENDINFQTVIGVSAGALSGANYVSGQIGRSARLNLGYRHDSNFVGLKAIKKARSIINLDFAIKDYDKIEPFNFERFQDTRRTFVAVATNCLDGTPKYFFNGEDNILDGIKASSTIPFLSPFVYIDNVPYLDGGCSNAIPFSYGIENHFNKIVVIRTRDKNFRCKERKIRIAKAFYRKYPNLSGNIIFSNYNYNNQVDELDELEKLGKVFVIAPTHELKIGRIEKDMEKLGQLYFEGYEQGLKIIDDLKKYLQE